MAGSECIPRLVRAIGGRLCVAHQPEKHGNHNGLRSLEINQTIMAEVGGMTRRLDFLDDPLGAPALGHFPYRRGRSFSVSQGRSLQQYILP